jgi:glycosyltransferase involved in cell wall biosynthesis
MRILYHAPDYVCLDGDAGGVYRELLTRKAMAESQGANAELFQMWNPEQLRSADVFHAFFPAAGSYPVCRAAVEAGCRLVVSPIYDYSFPHAMARGWVRFSQRVQPLLSHLGELGRVLAMANAVVVRSGVEMRAMERVFRVPSSRIRRVWNALPDDVQGLDADPDAGDDVPGLENGLLFAGDAANPRKNVARLLRAAAPLGVTTVLCGPLKPGRITSELIQLARSYRHIHILGKVTRERLSALMRRAKVFALPSLYEGTGLAALEAGSLGCNVVVTTEGGARDYFEDMATYVNPRSVGSIRSGIEAALAQSRGGRLATHLRDNFSPARLGSALMEVYRSIAKEAR